VMSSGVLWIIVRDAALMSLSMLRTEKELIVMSSVERMARGLAVVRAAKRVEMVRAENCILNCGWFGKDCRW